MKGIVLLFVSALNAFSLPAAEPENPRLDTSRNLAASLQVELGAKLMAALTSDGPVAAITVCQLEAGAIAERLSSESPAKVGRTALKVRNPANAADEQARGVLKTFQQRLEDGEEAPLEYFATAEDGSAVYLRSIVMQPMCLACHGSELTAEVQAAVAELYPFDEATGFAAGDLRGAFIVDWPVLPTAGD